MTGQPQGFATIPRSMLHDGGVPRDAKLVYLILSSHVGGAGMAWPSHRRMAELLGMHLSTVKRQLAWLRDNGYIAWEQQHRDDEALTTNSYVILAGSAPSPANKLGSVRARGSSVRTQVGSEGATPKLSGSEGIAHTELVNESQENESQGTKNLAPAKASAIDQTFAEFWSIYPRREGKGAAQVALAKALRRKVPAEQILAGARRFAADPNLPDAQFIAHPATWLNQARWGDDPLPPRMDNRRRPQPVTNSSRPAWEA